MIRDFRCKIGGHQTDWNYLNEKIIVFTNIYPFILKKQEFNKNICKELYLL